MLILMDTSKVCIGCQQRKPLEEFYKAGAYYQARCKPCNIQAVAEYGAANPEKRRQYHADYRARNRNTPRAKARQIREGMAARSKKKGFPSPEWTIDEIEPIIQGCCCRTGIPFEFDQSTYSKSPWTPVPDRIDSTKGYTHDNVQWVCHMFNSMKQEYTQAEVDRFIHALKLADGNF